MRVPVCNRVERGLPDVAQVRYGGRPKRTPLRASKMEMDFGINQAFVEELRQRYEDNAAAVPDEWRRYFASLHGVPPVESTERALAAGTVQGRVSSLINAFRARGHLFADLDPLGLADKPPPELNLESFGLTERDLDTVVACGDLVGPPTATLRDIVQRLQRTYTSAIGVEFTYLEQREERLWLQERMEATDNRPALSREDHLRILTKLTDAEIFEQFLHTNFLGAKRFSCEGSESMIPLIDLIIDGFGRLGGREVVIAIAHRGRLNVLANIMGKNVRALFRAFDDNDPEANIGRGDVKYHLGYSSDCVTSGGHPMHLSLAFNPSHLEFVGAVVAGRVRAKQDREGDSDRRRIVPLVLHGDAAFMGQGIIAETLNMSGLEGYRVGGTLHVVVNNQVGFTTSPMDSRSTYYATDLTRMLRAPVFHVNGEDLDAVAQAARLAVAYRQRFAKDVCIDLYGYRKYGHNEGDEPRFTQPVMYRAIDAKPPVRQVYAERLARDGLVTAVRAQQIAVERKNHLETELAEARRDGTRLEVSTLEGLWAGYRTGRDADLPDVATGVPAEELSALMERMLVVPDGFHAHAKVAAVWEQRLKHLRAGTRTLDWGAGEALAFASLLADGVCVRLSGQDSRRGTFAHRHAVMIDSTTGARHSPFSVVAKAPARIEVWDSPLSEAGVMGFDYGYSLDSPEALVVWEAQFGDFANGAQVIIDQFLSAADDKWNRLSGLVLLLPHGFEGQGPEHSSARLERFLQLAAEDNMFVCNLTTSAQLFHALRRQVHRALRKPLVIMTPKSLLRQSFSSIDEYANGGFRRVIPDVGWSDGKSGRVDVAPADVETVLVCSGKVFYDLDAARAARGARNVGLVRIEQLYPLSKSEWDAALAPYSKAKRLVWVQEEPWNMGAWYYLAARLPGWLEGRFTLECIAREESASPATGSLASHRVEQARLIDRAFT